MSPKRDFKHSMRTKFAALSDSKKEKKVRLDEFGKVIDEEEFHAKRSFKVSAKEYPKSDIQKKILAKQQRYIQYAN